VILGIFFAALVLLCFKFTKKEEKKTQKSLKFRDGRFLNVRKQRGFAHWNYACPSGFRVSVRFKLPERSAPSSLSELVAAHGRKGWVCISYRPIYFLRWYAFWAVYVTPLFPGWGPPLKICPDTLGEIAVRRVAQKRRRFCR